MTDEIKKAFQHVKKFYPHVNMVVFNSEGQWQYFAEDFAAPVFGKEIDVNILQDAIDSVSELPAVFKDH